MSDLRHARDRGSSGRPLSSRRRGRGSEGCGKPGRDDETNRDEDLSLHLELADVFCRGDQANQPSSAGLRVRFRSPLPSALMT